jgi:hypothetical protein
MFVYFSDMSNIYKVHVYARLIQMGEKLKRLERLWKRKLEEAPPDQDKHHYSYAAYGSVL